MNNTQIVKTHQTKRLGEQYLYMYCETHQTKKWFSEHCMNGETHQAEIGFNTCTKIIEIHQVKRDCE